MSKFRIFVSIDEKNYFWIITQDSIIINNNPKKEDLIGTKTKSYNETNICPRCREENNITDKSILYPGNSRHEIDKTGKETGGWVCAKHWTRNYHHSPTSSHTAMKLTGQRRTGNLRDPRMIFAQNCEKLTSTWRNVDILSEKYDNYNLPFDHSKDSKLGIIQTKGISQSVEIKGLLEYDCWRCSIVHEHKKIFNYLILYCFSKDRKLIERIYIISYSEIVRRGGIYIPKTSTGWCEKYRTMDNNVINNVNKLWNKILEENNGN